GSRRRARAWARGSLSRDVPCSAPPSPPSWARAPPLPSRRNPSTRSRPDVHDAPREPTRGRPLRAKPLPRMGSGGRGREHDDAERDRRAGADVAIAVVLVAAEHDDVAGREPIARARDGEL